MATPNRNAARGTIERTICDQCGNQRPPFNDKGVCEVCAASWSGYEEGQRFATLLGLGHAIERALEDGEVTVEQVRATVELALAGQTHGDDVQAITEGHDVAPHSHGASDDMIDCMLRVLDAELTDLHNVVSAARRLGQPIDTRLLSRRLSAAMDGLGGGQWLKTREGAAR